METKMETAQIKKHRSPAYPSIDLQTAVEKAALLYEDVKKNATHFETALTTMGFTAGSSRGGRAVAAMISYGLLEEDGAGPQRTVRLTKDALDLQHLPQDDPDRISILRRMALKPKIFADIAEQYPEHLPNDATIEKYLKVTRSFNPDAVKPLINAFRLTYQFANLDNLGILSDDKDGELGQETLDFQDNPGKKAGTDRQRSLSPAQDDLERRKDRNVRMNNQEDMRTLTIPLPGERIAFLEVPVHSSANDFRFMLRYLELMQDAWVGHPDLRASARTAPKIRFGSATWHGPETDEPVMVVGYWGERDGKHYVEIEGSNTGVPFDQIKYDKE